MSWCKTSASVAGTRHKQNGDDCQDVSGCEIIDGNIIVGAISDGMGSAKYSKDAAELAVRVSIGALKTWWVWRKEIYQQQQLKDTKESHANINSPKKDDLNYVFKEIFNWVVHYVKDTAQANQHDIKDYNCTWLSFIITPESIAFAHIGDGFFVIRESKSSTYKSIASSLNQKEYINSTDSILSVNAFDKLKIDVLDHSCDFFCVGTDGLELACLKYPDAEPFHDWFEHFEHFIVNCKKLNPSQYEIEIENSLIEFLSSSTVEEHTDDDCTIVIGCNTSEFSTSDLNSEKWYKYFSLINQILKKMKVIS
jgi:hypothetical protein